jgi:two-component system, OmpR family, response regulator ArlR
MPQKILVVDNDNALQVLLNVLLTRAGFECEFASDGNGALDKLDGKQKYSVLMLDLILPGVSGLEILRRLQTENPAMLQRTIVLTSASHGILQQLDTSRVHAVIRKPFDIQHMIQLTTACASQE